LFHQGAAASVEWPNIGPALVAGPQLPTNGLPASGSPTRPEDGGKGMQ
jgi:hypothetical protein